MKTVLICSLLIGGHIDHSIVKSAAECRAKGVQAGASMVDVYRRAKPDKSLCGQNLPAGVSGETCRF